jgi:microcystin-dependent protein
MLEWTVEVRNASLARVGQLSEFDLTDFVCVPRVNTLGSWSIKLPNTVLNASGVRVPHALGAVLRTQGSGLIVTGPNGVVLTGPMTFASQESTSDAPDGVWTIEGVSDAVILARPTAFPQPSNSNPATQSVSNDVRSGLGEALMRSYVSANIGPTASVARKLPDLTLSADGGRGVSLAKSPRFQNLLELTQEIALGSGLLFDVVQVGSGRQFQVTAPQDVSASVRWDIANNQLSRSKYGYSAPGVTRVFVAGQGEGTARTIVEVTTPASLLSEAIWGRIERFVDQRNTDDVTELTQAGLELLAAEGTTVTSLEVVPSSDLADGFGSTWFLGSWVTIVVNDTEVRAQIVEVPISISTAGVLVGAVVGDSTGFDWESVLSARQQKTESRVSALEQNAESSVGGAGTDGPLPAGAIVEWTGATAPANWLLCRGQAVSRVGYASLFAAIGTTYGAGDGSATFNIPAHNGRVAVGFDSAQTEFNALGKTGGSKTHTLTAQELPDHAHGAAGGTGTTAIGTGDVKTRSQGPGDAAFRTAATVHASGGWGSAAIAGSREHNNLSPYIAVNFIIKTSNGDTPGDSQLTDRVGVVEGAAAAVGLVRVIPPTFSTVGGSSSRAGAVVTFTNANAVSLNGVFTSDYANYRLAFNPTSSSAVTDIVMRFRVAGADNATSNYYYGLSYTAMAVSPAYTGIGAAATNLLYVCYIEPTADRNGFTMDLSNPANSSMRKRATWQAVTYRSGGFNAVSGAGVLNLPGVAADGFSILASSGTMSGTVTVYGYNN